MSKETTYWLLASLLWLTACSDGKLVVIQPGAFTEDWPTVLRKELVDNKRCLIDSINNQPPNRHTLAIKSGETLTIAGWAAPKTDGVSGSLYIQLVGPALTYTAVAQTRVARADVNQLFNLDPNWNAGFQLEAMQNAEPSEYRLDILQPGEHGIAYCKTSVTIKIEPAGNGT